MGGKPSKGTPADKRLKANKPKAAASRPAMPAMPRVNRGASAADPDPYNFASKPWQGN